MSVKSIKTCSKANGNEMSTIRTGTDDILTFQEKILDSIEEIIQNKLANGYKRSHVNTNLTAPPVPGTGGFVINFSESVGDDINEGNSIPIVVTYNQVTGDFTVFFDGVTPNVIPYTSAVLSGGATNSSVNIEYNPTSGVLTLKIFYDAPGPTLPDSGNITRQLSFNMASVLLNAVPPINIATASSLFTPIMRNDNGTVYIADPPTLFSQNLNATILGITFDNSTSYALQLNTTNNIDIGPEEIEIVIQPGIAYIPVIQQPPIHLFYVPTSVSQVLVPSKTLLRDFLLKDDFYTLESTILITDPETVALTDYISKEVFLLIRNAMKAIDSLETSDEICPSEETGTFQGCVSNCLFSMNISL